MLSKGIYTACTNGVAQLKAAATLATESKAIADADKTEAVPHIFSVAQKEFISNKDLSNEVFGPVSLIVLCKNTDEICEALQGLDGQLTATVHANAADEAYVSPVIELMKEKAGRILFGGFPTGVEVCDAMVHGGPFPATSDARSTSVGTGAILRFVRPVAYQNFPQPLLPDALKDSNPLNILRIVNGSHSSTAI
jgi:2,5-dioxopentanoate dehydrogenase